VRSKYPWDKWFDGRIWHLVGGKDFACKPQSMLTQARKAADVQTLYLEHVIQDGDIWVRATPADDPEAK
jgi:hypothetical protein